MRTFTCGIDPSSETFYASVYQGLDTLQIAPREFPNTPEGYEDFEAHLITHEIAAEQLLIGIEHTGVYSEKLCYWLHGRGYALVLLEPFKVWKASETGPKSDPIDCRKIAEYAMRYDDRLRLWRPNEVVVEQVKTLLTTREQLVQQRTALKNSRTALQRKAIRTPPAIAALEGTVDHVHRQINALEEEIERLIRAHPSSSQMLSMLMTTPGVGLLLGAHFFVLTNAFTRTLRYRSLAQYLGIAPNEHTSGLSVRRPSRSRRYGPKIMRKLLHLAARSVSEHRPVYRRYYLRKQQEGKPKSLVLNNISNKLVKVLCGMIRDQKPYIENYQSVNPMLLKA